MASSREDTNKQQQVIAKEISRFYRYIKIGVFSARTNLRPWNDFMKHLQAPSQQAGWPAFEMRIFSNLWYFRSNYIVIALALSIYTIFTNIKLLLAILLISLICIYVFGLMQMPLNLGNGVVLSRMQTIAAVAFISLLILWNLSALAPAIFALCLSTSVILLHAALRHANVKARIAKAAQDLRMQFGGNKDVDGEVGELGVELLNSMGVFGGGGGGGSEEGADADPERGILGGTLTNDDVAEKSSVYDDLQADATEAATSAMMRARRQHQIPQQTAAPPVPTTQTTISPTNLPRPGVKQVGRAAQLASKAQNSSKSR